MDVHRTNVWRPLSRLRAELDRQFGDWFDNVPRVSSAGQYPAVNVWEADDHLFAEAELPGVAPDDLDVSVVNNELTIKGVRQERLAEGATMHRNERGAGAFTRVIPLPYEVDPNGVQATLRDGVLLLSLPKHEAAKPRKIRVAATGATG